jgi:hypothetical protein
MSDHYYDAGAGAWRAEDADPDTGADVFEGVSDGGDYEARDDGAKGEEQVTSEERLRASIEKGKSRAEDAAEAPELSEADRRWLAAMGRGERSGGGRNHGRRRGSHGTGTKGRGIRGLRQGPNKGFWTTEEAEARPYVPQVRATGRQLGAPAPAAVSRRGMRGAPDPDVLASTRDLMERVLGPRRVEVLRAGLKGRGASSEERAARVYLAVLLRHVPWSDHAAADLLLDASDDKAIRKIQDVRRRDYDAAKLAAAKREMRESVKRWRTT